MAPFHTSMSGADLPFEPQIPGTENPYAEAPVCPTATQNAAETHDTEARLGASPPRVVIGSCGQAGPFHPSASTARSIAAPLLCLPALPSPTATHDIADTHETPNNWA